MNPSKIGVVIVTYNSEQYIVNCLRSVLNNSYPNFKVVVVDNASKDSTRRNIREHFPQIKLIKKRANLGYAKANNQGIKFLLKQKVKFILLLNPDTIVSENLIFKLYKAMVNMPKIAITGPIITYQDDPQKIWFAGGSFSRLFCYAHHKFINQRLNETQISSGPTDFVTGACMMIKSEIIEKIGLLPDQYFLYFEDVHFCNSVKEAGFECLLFAEPLVRHIISASTGTTGSNELTPLRAYYFARNPLIFIKHNNRFLFKYIGFSWQILIRLPYYSLGFIRHGALKNLSAYLRGLIDGFYHPKPSPFTS